MTEQQVNEHFDNLDLSEMAPDGGLGFNAADAKANPGEVIGKICTIYHKIRPFLDLVDNLFFIPKKWREAIKSYMVLMDAVCPG